MIGSTTWRRVDTAAIVAFVLAGCAIPLSTAADTDGRADEKPRTSTTQLIPDDAAVRVYLEAVTQIEQRALFSSQRDDHSSIVADTLKAYLADKDPFSDFLTREEYLGLKQIRGEQYVGIGLEIDKNRDGEVVCFPYLGGPAAKAGIQTGDRLIKINDSPVRRKSLPTLAAMALGTPGSQVTVEIAKENGTRRLLSITRSIVDSKTILEDSYDSTPVIRILTFTPDTKRRLDYLISNWNENQPIVLDLCGNSGGDLHAAIDSAMLFLRAGDEIVSVKGKDGVKSYFSTIARNPPKQPVFLWQDHATASAAEVFIAALTENSRAVSIGKRSFGKGTRQDIIELSNGAALILTTGYLRTPRGNDFDGRGLDPVHAIQGDGTRTASYLAKMTELVKKEH